jgi:hypothetical protein
VVIASCTLLAPVVWAQTEADARAMFERGNEHLQRAMEQPEPARTRELREALSWYHRSLRVTRARSVLFNIALCYEQLRRNGDAFTYYQEYLSLDDLAATDRSAAQTALDRLGPTVALIEVSSRPAGATIYIDRRDLSPRGVSPSVVATTPGPHRVILELEGYQPAQVRITSALGQTEQAQVELQALPAQVTIITEPAGAEIRIDDHEGPVVGISPATVSLPAGPHQVFVTQDDQRGRRLFDAPPGGRLSVIVELQAPTTPGVVDLNADVPGAQVSIDGRLIGPAPLRELRLPPGVHRFTVTGGPAYQSWSDTLEVGPGHEVSLDVHLAPSVPQRRFGIWPNVGLVAAATIAVTGAALGGWTLALQREFDAIKQTCRASLQACTAGTALHRDERDLAANINRMAIATDVLLATAAAAGIVSTVLIFLNRELADRSRVEIALAPFPDGLLASVTTRGMLR